MVKDHPPEGKSCSARCIFASLQTYAKLLQAVLNRDPIILSEEVWQMAIKDNRKDYASLDNRKGGIEPGKDADFVVFDPLAVLRCVLMLHSALRWSGLWIFVTSSYYIHIPSFLKQLVCPPPGLGH